MARGLPSVSSAEAFRVRRWDVLMLGTALPGLVAAVRLGQKGLRVLVLGEAGADDGDDFAREPFALGGAGAQDLLGECLRALGVPLIDQRRFVSEDVALQVCDAASRVDLGRSTLTAEEWAGWGLASREDAHRWVQDLHGAAERERETLLATSLAVRAKRRTREALSAPRRAEAPRGWPASLDGLPPALRSLLDAPTRALSNLGDRAPSREARARLVGGLLGGGTTLSGGGRLRELLRRRVETLYGEFRELDGAFQLVSVAHQPGLALDGSREIWSGRALVLNAPVAAVADAAEGEAPDLLRAGPIRRRRTTRHFRGPTPKLPPGMADRVVWRDPEDDESVALRVFRGARRDGGFDLLASAVVPADSPEAERAAAARIDRALRNLLPFAWDDLDERPLRPRRWDADSLLADPAGAAWPDEPELRLSSRPAIYALERASVGGLGGEGELWLGWRAGDAIAAELA